MKDTLARKALYIEAINEKRHDTNLLAEQQAEIVELRKEIKIWKPEHEPISEKAKESYKKVIEQRQFIAKQLIAKGLTK